jgi:hypothetical protein
MLKGLASDLASLIFELLKTESNEFKNDNQHVQESMGFLWIPQPFTL